MKVSRRAQQDERPLGADPEGQIRFAGLPRLVVEQLPAAPRRWRPLLAHCRMTRL
ncbi:MAG: hypothetical protein IPM76_24310 [Chloroflexi bacterium]|nr:hypothetical protein [Chloroflexota bacterium]